MDLETYRAMVNQVGKSESKEGGSFHAPSFIREHTISHVDISEENGLNPGYLYITGFYKTTNIIVELPVLAVNFWKRYGELTKGGLFSKGAPEKAKEALKQIYETYFRSNHQLFNFVIEVAGKHNEIANQFLAERGLERHTINMCATRSQGCGVVPDPANLRNDQIGYFTTKPYLTVQFNKNVLPPAKEFIEYPAFQQMRYNASREYNALANDMFNKREVLEKAFGYASKKEWDRIPSLNTEIEMSPEGDEILTSNVMLVKADGSKVRVGEITYLKKDTFIRVKDVKLTLKLRIAAVNEFNTLVLEQMAGDINRSIQEVGPERHYEVIAVGDPSNPNRIKGKIISYEYLPNCIVALVLQVSTVGVRYLIYLVSNVKVSADTASQCNVDPFTYYNIFREKIELHKESLRTHFEGLVDFAGDAQKGA